MNNFLRLLRIKLHKRIDNNLLVFTSFHGKYADGPKVLSDAIHKQDLEKSIVWLVNDVNDTNIPNYVKKIKYGSKEADLYYGKAKAIIDNVYCDHEYYTHGRNMNSTIKYRIGLFLRSKNGQRYYTTWHGTMIKRIGSDSIKNNSFNFDCQNTTMFLDNRFAKDVIKRITMGKIDIKLMGAPRNDILFDKSIEKDSLRKRLGLPVDKKIIIYAPTFRSNMDGTRDIENSGIKQINELNIDMLLRALSKKFGGDWVFVARFHYHVEKAMDWDRLKRKYKNIIINGNKSDDIMDYLACCDALLTDVSSCIYDFGFTNRPAFIFFPDYNNYCDIERGLYFRKEELPWSVALTAEELYLNIRNFNQGNYEKDLALFYKKLGFIPGKKCADKIAKFILDDLSGNNNKRNEENEK